MCVKCQCQKAECNFPACPVGCMAEGPLAVKSGNVLRAVEMLCAACIVALFVFWAMSHQW